MIIANENSGYIYFEVIEQIEAKCILDVGMFLKRIGNVSRCAMERYISENVELDGVDFFPEVNFPVWKEIYNNVIEYKVYEEAQIDKQYDLIVLLGSVELCSKMNLERMINKLQACGRYALIDDLKFIVPFLRAEWKIQDLKVEEDIYYLIDFGDKG